LLLWGYIFRRELKISPAIVLPAGLILLALHPIAAVYLCAGIAMLTFFAGHPRKLLRANVVMSILGLGLSVVASLMLPIVAPNFSLSAAGNVYEINFGTGLIANTNAAQNWVTGVAVATPVVLFLAGLSPFLLGLSRALSREVLAALAAIFLVICASLFVYLPGFPGEIFSRLLMPLTVTLSGLAGLLVVTLFHPERAVAIRVSALLVTFAAVGMAIQPWAAEIVHNTNIRPTIIDESAFSAQLDRLPNDTTLLYLETDQTLNTSLLMGGDRFGALALPALRGSAALNQLIEERRPQIAVAPIPQPLNIDAQENRRSLQPRRNGFSFQRVSHLLLVGRQREIGELFLWVRQPRGDRALLRLYDNPRSLQDPGRARQILVQPGHTGWLRTRSGVGRARALLIELPAGPGWIEGISMGRPSQHVRWPWTEGIQINFLLRDSAGEQFQNLPLSIPDLMNQVRAENLLGLLRRKSTVLSDDSGFVFLNTVFSLHEDDF
jgi:hypothetical protein